MKESLLQWIWQYQYFNAHDLRTTAGQILQVSSSGELNTHQGPDFLDARIKIGDTWWAGAVELHRVASDWEKHTHQTDKNYRNVILHVVWVDDAEAEVRTGQRGIPTLVLEHRVPKWLLGRYEEWMKSRDFIACQQQMAEVGEGVWRVWKEQLMEERLKRRTGAIADRLRTNRQHWEETCWWMMARAFGGTVNGEAFEMIARSLPVTMIARQSKGDHRIEALLLGQAGLLEGAFKDDHPRRLQQEFHHLRLKYGLLSNPVPVHFLRMRPGNFPSVRLAQLAGLMEGCSSWFSRIREAEGPDMLKEWMEVAASGYWDDHYIPDRPSVRRVKRLGEALKDSLIINVFAPLVYTYGCHRDDPGCREKAIGWLKALKAEKNVILAGWARLGVRCGHAGDSQALLELKKRYCEPKNCLQCAVGKTLLGRTA